MNNDKTNEFSNPNFNVNDVPNVNKELLEEEKKQSDKLDDIINIDELSGVMVGNISSDIKKVTIYGDTSKVENLSYIPVYVDVEVLIHVRRNKRGVFGHADFAHFIGNASYILLLGPLLEEKYSSKVLISVIAVTAVITGLVNNICFPNVALCGASGVVFAFILLSSFILPSLINLSAMALFLSSRLSYLINTKAWFGASLLAELQ